MRGSKIIIKEVKDKKAWESFNTSFDHPSFFQSWHWGNVQKAAGVEVLRLGIFHGKEVVGIMQVADVKARRGHFLHIRGGPVINTWNKSLAHKIIRFLKILAKEKGASFIRFSPLVNASLNLYKEIFEEIGCVLSPTHNIDAENRWVLDLTRSESQILSNMRKTTRYLIKKSQNLNIEIVKSNKVADINKFLKLYKQTFEIKHFVPHSLIQEEFNEFNNHNMAIIYMASLNEELISTAIVIYYGSEAIYRHGATSIRGRKLPGSYLIQWEAILDAKKKGHKRYNFFGISPDENKKNHPWYGLTLFKMGFGGERVDFMHSMDFPIGFRYWITYFIDLITKKMKGY